MLGRVREREQTGQTRQLGIRSQGRFSKWFLFFKSSSSSPHQNPLNLKNKQVKKRRFPLFPSRSSYREGAAEPALPRLVVSPLDCVSETIGLRPERTARWRGRLSCLSHYPHLHPSPPIYNLSVILVITLYVFSWVFIIYNARECLTLNTSWNDCSFLP